MRGQKPVSPAYPQTLKTLGDHLRKKRLDLKLLQREVAQKLGVDEASVWNWENNRTSPALYYMPKIVEFLGYSPYKDTKTLGEKILNYRRLSGMTQKELAKLLGIHPSTLSPWERSKSQPLKRHIVKLIFSSRPMM